MANVIVYTTRQCPYCLRAKALLDRKQVSYQEIPVDSDLEARDRMIQLSGRRTVPQIFIDDKPIGGFDDLYVLDQTGELDRLLG